jgi:uncharacterized protein YbcV (DUF1398 family)
MCRAPFVDVMVIPNPMGDPHGWFEAVDTNHSGELSYAEVLEGLKATLPVDWKKIEADTDRLWSIWDANRSGSISIDEFMNRSSGMMTYILDVSESVCTLYGCKNLQVYAS